MITLEVCANSVQSALNGQRGGAVRVELCDNLSEGGTTPSLSQIEISRQLLDIQLNVLIRPREGDFLYSDLEFEEMKYDIHVCGKTKCDGVVFGILNPDGSVDMKRNKELVDIAKQYGMSVTFHRAFDRCADIMKSLEDVIELGCDRILTSGGKVTTSEGKDVLKELIEKAGDRIKIMPGGGITENNISDLVKSTGLKEFHGSFRSQYRGRMEYVSPVFNNIDEEYSLKETDTEKVKLAIANANR
ncbi:MAG: copper homeostasis protein CutC [Dysgonomonas sp.]|nr:copper homeostasis protein CutC [Dysgonomonas sp.]